MTGRSATTLKADACAVSNVRAMRRAESSCARTAPRARCAMRASESIRNSSSRVCAPPSLAASASIKPAYAGRALRIDQTPAPREHREDSAGAEERLDGALDQIEIHAEHRQEILREQHGCGGAKNDSGGLLRRGPDREKQRVGHGRRKEEP